MRNIILISFIVFSFFSCTVHETDDMNMLFYGNRDSVKISVDYALLPVVTKAPAVNEFLMENVNLYVINELGDLVYYSYATERSEIEICVYENMKYSVYALVNANAPVYAKCYDEIKALRYGIADYSGMVSERGGVLMSGCVESVQLSDKQNITLDLKRCVAKVILKCDYSMLNPDVEIAIDEVSLKNIPLSVMPFAESRIIDGADAVSSVLVENPTVKELEQGILFYQYENIQGVLQEGNLEQKDKWWPEESEYSEICSYVELKGNYLSSQKRGEIIYRFYLGKDMVSDYSVERNLQYVITLCFKGDGAIDENSWRVDNSEIVDLVTSVEVSPESHKFTELGASLQLSATVQPLTAADKTLQWISSDEKVATVDQSGKVTATGDGTCTITATSTDGTNISAECAITVDSKIYVTGITVEPATMTLFTGETGELKATIEPDDATVPDIIWSSSDDKVATVDGSGKVTAVAPGEAVITATSKDDSSKKATCTVTVQAKEFSIDPTSKTLYVGESFTISYKVKPPVSPVFESQSPGIATVDQSGKVTAVAGGEAKIKVSAHGIDLYCTVTVVNPQIGFPASGRVMYNGETVTIPYSVLVPADSDINISLSNSNAQIISSNSAGITVKAITPGSCRITASIGPVSATYDLDIQQLRIVPKESSFVIFDHFDYQIEYDILPEHASDSFEAEVTLSPRAALFVFIPKSDNPTNLRVSTTTNPNGNRYLPSDTEQMSLVISLKGRSDATANMTFTIDEVSIAPVVRAAMNGKYNTPSNAYLDRHAPAGSGLSDPIWTSRLPKGGFTLKWDSGVIAFNNPTADNGEYPFTATCTGTTDGYEITLNSKVILYETIYLVGMTNTITVNRMEPLDQYNFEYVNQMVARWYTSPNSQFFAEDGRLTQFLGNEIPANIPFKYNGQVYTSSSIGFSNYNVSFQMGDRITLFDGSGYTFNGIAPQQYYMNVPLQAVDDENEMYSKINLNGIDVYIYGYTGINIGNPAFALNTQFPWELVYNRAF